MCIADGPPLLPTGSHPRLHPSSGYLGNHFPIFIFTEEHSLGKVLHISILNQFKKIWRSEFALGPQWYTPPNSLISVFRKHPCQRQSQNQSRLLNKLKLLPQTCLFHPHNQRVEEKRDPRDPWFFCLSVVQRELHTCSEVANCSHCHCNRLLTLWHHSMSSWVAA